MIIYPYKIKDEKSEISINLSFRVQHWLSTAPSMRGEATLVIPPSCVLCKGQKNRLAHTLLTVYKTRYDVILQRAILVIIIMIKFKTFLYTFIFFVPII